MNCVGEGYDCIDGRCYCALGYTPNNIQNMCVKCPGLGEICTRTCCNTIGNGSIYCWHGICTHCYDEKQNWICRDKVDKALIVSISQIAMATALVLGILATFVLLYKLCTSTDMRHYDAGIYSRQNSRISIGSLQIYVNERLRDAPPRYTRAPPIDSTTHPTICFLNTGFVHDSSIPPPPYSAIVKTVDASQTENHM